MIRPTVRKTLLLGTLTGFFGFLSLGCGGEGSTVDTKPTAPPVTAESGKDLANQINSQKGTMGPGGVAAPAKK